MAKALKTTPKLLLQSAIELLIAYAWAILLLAIFITAIILLSQSNSPLNSLPTGCNIQPLLPCQQSILVYPSNSISPIRYYLIFSNNLGQPLYFPAGSFNLTATDIGKKGTSSYFGNCTPSFAPQGAQLLCSANITGSYVPDIGTRSTVSFKIGYQICQGADLSTCTGTIYSSKGSSTQTMSQSGIVPYLLKLVSAPASGVIALNGVRFPSNSQMYLIGGNYVLFAVPPTGYTLSSWAVNNLMSSLSSPSTQNTLLTLASNSTVTATFVVQTTTSTTIPTSTVPATTST